MIFRLVRFIKVINRRRRKSCPRVPRGLHSSMMLPHIAKRSRHRVNIRHIRTLILRAMNLRLISRASTPPFLARMRRRTQAVLHSRPRHHIRLLATVTARQTRSIANRTFQVRPTRRVNPVTRVPRSRHSVVLTIRPIRVTIHHRFPMSHKRHRNQSTFSRHVIHFPMFLRFLSNRRQSLVLLNRPNRIKNPRRPTVIIRSLTTRTTFTRSHRPRRISNHLHIPIPFRGTTLLHRRKRRIPQSTRVRKFRIVKSTRTDHRSPLFNKSTNHNTAMVSKRHGDNFVIVNIILSRKQGRRLINRLLTRKRTSRSLNINYRRVSIPYNNQLHNASRVPLILPILIVSSRGRFSFPRHLRHHLRQLVIRSSYVLSRGPRQSDESYIDPIQIIVVFHACFPGASFSELAAPPAHFSPDAIYTGIYKVVSARGSLPIASTAIELVPSATVRPFSAVPSDVSFHTTVQCRATLPSHHARSVLPIPSVYPIAV